MGQPEVLKAVARLNNRLNRPVTKQEIADEVGYHKVSVEHSLSILRRWREVEVVKDHATRPGCKPYRYEVPQHVRERIGVDSSE